MGLMDRILAALNPTQVLKQRIQDHFQQDPAGFSILSENFTPTDYPNVFLALQDYLAHPNRQSELLGVASDHHTSGMLLSQIVTLSTYGPKPSPIEHTSVPLHDDQVLTCVSTGLYLLRDGETRLAVAFRGPGQVAGMSATVVEVLASRREDGEALLGALRVAIRCKNIYKGHVVSLAGGMGHLVVNFHRLPQIARQDIILPAEVLDRIERQTIRFTRYADLLRQSGRHLKRGILLHGVPGTGKTLSAMYLAGQMPDRTVLLLTGQGMGLLEETCRMARLLQPATVVLEDVDLIAEERTHPGSHVLLFELLNQMDGLADDADIMFLLTTNRPDLLEPALAARPGRVDQAIEIPLPDAECRRRLIELYGKGLDLHVEYMDRLISRTEGVSAAFIRELMRKAALFAADDGSGLSVRDDHLEVALHELVVTGGQLTRRILGADKFIDN